MEKTINKLNINKGFEFFPNWFFDKENYSIYTTDNHFYLTKKELTFFRILLENRVVTYTEMHDSIWLKKEKITQNAIRLFVKNFKKKIPAKILRNIPGVGYKLITIK